MITSCKLRGTRYFCLYEDCHESNHSVCLRLIAQRGTEDGAEKNDSNARVSTTLSVLGNVIRYPDRHSGPDGYCQSVPGFGIRHQADLLPGDGSWFRFTIIASDVWKEFGFNTIIFLAALSGINPALYEAAEVDGAGRWKQTMYITIPALIPIGIVIATLALGNVLNANFDQIFNLYSPLIYQQGDIIDTFVYREGLLSGQFSFATAVNLFKSVISLILIVISYRLAYRFAGYRIF